MLRTPDDQMITTVKDYMVLHGVPRRRFFVLSLTEDCDKTLAFWCNPKDRTCLNMLLERSFDTMEQADRCRRRVLDACCGLVTVVILEFGDGEFCRRD